MSHETGNVVTLDTTLKDLYDDSLAAEKDLYLVYNTPTAEKQIISGVPMSKKFTYQAPLSRIPEGDALARYFYSVLPQWCGIIAGNMNMIMFDLDVSNGTTTTTTEETNGTHEPQHRLDAIQVMNQLAPEQRPKITFVKSVDDIVLPAGAKLALHNPMDCFEQFPLLVPADSHYQATSKRELAVCGLPTPPSEAVDPVLSDVRDDKWRAEQVTRMIDCIRAKPLPFVVKLPRATGGQGTFIIREETERSESLVVLQKEIDRMLTKVTDANAHLYPASFVLQEMAPGSSLAISIFVTKSGDAIVTSCCDQYVDAKGQWGGAHISYPKQEGYKSEYTPIMQKLAQFAHKYGITGPIGADVMTNEKGEHLIIDINTRVTGSHPLGFLTKHFNVERGFNEAAICPVPMTMTMEAFKEMFKTEFEQGRLIIAGWCHGPGMQSSMSTIIVGGEDEARLGELIGRLRALRVVRR